jgi:hypothetical protein
MGGKPSVAVDNTLARQFDVGVPCKAWVTDITYIPTMEGFAYLAVVLDLYSRRVVGWSMQSRQGHRCGVASFVHSGLATKANKPCTDPFRSRLAVHQYGLGCLR